ncbi:membrane-bound lytic murein transglycosylase B [Methylomarinovum caldicuralii]|uniref:Membrane-bound lytic murein transglycosylase B n=1 Tax=Methylomarinovum caldicuralii TaxID=438856 RepID=A0AAU9CGS0_9GAMM|nr:lytic murein transglycosylase B [Methylomarinovum caldicuralii]BCX80761.1 membrane-bound lytic murein transglycosylase B [Methylomarinovum caldicuralii]
MNAAARCNLLALVLAAAPAFGLPLAEYPEARQFIDTMAARHGLDRDTLTQALEQARIDAGILKAIQRPAEGLPWHRYRKIFLTEERIAGGVEFWRRHRRLLDQVAQKYGVPPEVVVAILGVETFYGTRTGGFRVLDALATLGFSYPRRAPFFRRELEQFFLLTREERLPPTEPVGSYAGAMGWPQFMPSSYRRYAADFDGDGKRDIWTNPADVAASVANYFVEHGWRGGQPVALPLPAEAAKFGDETLEAKYPLAELEAKGLKLPQQSIPKDLRGNVVVLDGESGPEAWLGLPNFYVITRYNRSRLYAMAVHQLSQAIRQRMEGAQ